MKTIIFGSWAIVLSLIVLSVLILPACASLYKVKSLELHQLKNKEENTILSQESKSESLHSVGSLYQSDSLSNWLWFESSQPFVFHPDNGLEAEKGKLILGGSRMQSNIGQENILRLSSSDRDSVIQTKIENAEKMFLREAEKQKNRTISLWWLLLLVPVIWFIKRR